MVSPCSTATFYRANIISIVCAIPHTRLEYILRDKRHIYIKSLNSWLWSSFCNTYIKMYVFMYVYECMWDIWFMYAYIHTQLSVHTYAFVYTFMLIHVKHKDTTHKDIQIYRLNTHTHIERQKININAHRHTHSLVLSSAKHAC